MPDELFFKYAALTILLGLLLGVSSLEYVIIKQDPGKYSNAQDKDLDTRLREIFYRNASAWALRGLFFALILPFAFEFGFLSGLAKYCLAIPLTFILAWIYYHMLGSVSIDLEGSAAESRKEMEESIIEIIRERSGKHKAINEKEVYNELRHYYRYSSLKRWILETLCYVHPGVKRLKPLWENIDFSLAEVRKILQQLCDRKFLHHQDGDNYLMHDNMYYDWMKKNRE